MTGVTECVNVPADGIACDGRPRLFCLAHAGGDASGYQTWRPVLAPSAEVLPVVLPGRGKRYKQDLATDLRQLSRTLAGELAPLTDVPYALFGHSLGAVIAFETARELTRCGRPPWLLIASASLPPPKATEPLGDRHLLADDAFLDAVVSVGGTPPEVLEQPELLRIVLPRLRADYTMAETYRYSGEEPKLPCPVITYSGVDDNSLHGGALEEWSHVSARESLPPRTFPGGHFYLEDSRTAVLEAVRTDLTAVLEGQPPATSRTEGVQT
jgi:medium-chain acyl-[acyl-carrier-protein] hydrolase